MTATADGVTRVEVDVVVIGLGPGGRSAAAELAKAGLEVVGVDEHLVGGECSFYGCTPSKMMVRAAELLAETRRVDGVAGASTLAPDWADVAGRIAKEATHGWHDDAEVDQLTASGVTFVRGHGRLAGPRSVDVDGQSFVARRGVVLCTGTRPAVPPIDGLENTSYWTNRDAVKVSQLPESMIVIGGGSIAVELCQVFARFGVSVRLIEVAERLLAQGEPEASALIAEAFAAEGIEVHTGAHIAKVTHAEGQFHVELEEQTLDAEQLLIVAGRTNNLSDIGLETVGLDPEAVVLETDDKMCVLDGLWAIGDITGEGGYTHVAHYQAAIVTAAILRGDGPRADYRAVPDVTFTDPEIGSVGMTEEQARDDGRRVLTGFSDLAVSPRGWIHKRGNSGFVKVVEDADEHVLVGATVAGPRAGELLAHLTLAVHARVPTGALSTMMYPFPTFTETIEAALSDLRDSS